MGVGLFRFKEFLAFLSVILFFPRRGERKNLCFFVVFLAFHRKTRERKIRGLHKHFAQTLERGEKTPTPKISALLRERPVLPTAKLVLTKDRKQPYYGHFRGKYTGRGLVVKRLGVLSKVQMLNLVLGGAGLFPSSKTLSACFLFFFGGGGTGDNLYKLSRNCLRKLCFCLRGCFWVGLSFMRNRNETAVSQ